jgi:hypothetical protein
MHDIHIYVYIGSRERLLHVPARKSTTDVTRGFGEATRSWNVGAPVMGGSYRR